MNIDETTLIEIQDYINALDEKVGLKPETMADVRNAISKHKYELKNLRLADVVGQSEQLADKGRYCNDCGDYVGKGCDNSDCKDFKG
jgi:hypothetical protein